MDKRIVSSVLVSTMLISSTISAIADDSDKLVGSVDETQVIDSEDPDSKDNTEAEVEATIPSTFSVIIPKQITMDGEEKKADYKVKVTGDIAGEEYVQVEPEEKVVLKQTGKENVEATISQDITIFRSSDYSETVTKGSIKISDTDEPIAVDGSIDASSVTAGTWSGTFWFNVLSQYINTDDISTLSAGFYDENNNLILGWDQSGIDVSIDYTYSGGDNYWGSSETSAYSVLKDYPEVAKVIIPDTVTSIGTYAFAGCSNLKVIKIPSSVTSMGRSVFSGCSLLDTVDLQANIDTIVGYTFSGCSKLKNITIPETVKSVSECAFQNCTSLTSIVIPDSVTALEGGAFYGCTGLSNITLSNKLESIGLTTFGGCSSLETLTLPESLKSIGQAAFNGAKLSNLYIYQVALQAWAMLLY